MLGVSALAFHGIGRSPVSSAHDAQRVVHGWAEDDDVVAVGQAGLVAHVVHGDVVVGDAVLVEGEPDPALVLRGLPRVHDGDARRGDRMGRHGGRAGGTVGDEAELGRGRLEDPRGLGARPAR